MSVPQRIQRKRTKGWRMPEGAVYVGRPTPWGNPYQAADYLIPGWPRERRRAAVWNFATYAEGRLVLEADWLVSLRGRDLACWCPLDQPCHADVLLELANA